MGAARRPIQDRLWSYVDRTGGPDACWNWFGKAVAKQGYGRLSVCAGKQVRAHRLAFELENGPIPSGLYVCHRCDNPKCCNPAHLFLGTAKQNTHDAKRKTRLKPPPVMRGDDHPLRKNEACRSRGEANGNSRYTAAQAEAVFLRKGGIDSIAKELGVGRNFVAAVRSGKAWKHVTQGLSR